MEGHRDDPLLQGRLGGELYLLLDHPLYLLVEGLDRILKLNYASDKIGLFWM